jgi:hypothetical protein
MPASPRLTRITFAAAAAAGLALPLGGCDLFNTQKPGGRLASLDQHTYVSTEWSPKTVSLVDVRSLEEIWSVDVPVGQKLVIRFYPNKSKDNIHNPDVMRWSMYPATQTSDLLDNQMPVPAPQSRRIEWELRAVPEYAPDSPPVATDPSVDAAFVPTNDAG